MAKNLLDVDAYIKALPEKTRKKVLELRLIIQKAAPQATETMSYGVPAFKLNGNLVLYAGFKNHVGLYPQPSAIKKFKTLLSKYDTSEGTVRFPISTPLPQQLISKIVAFRVKENLTKVTG